MLWIIRIDINEGVGDCDKPYVYIPSFMYGYPVEKT